MYTYITYVPDTMLNILHLLFYLILTVTLQSWFYYYAYVIGEKLILREVYVAYLETYI